MRERECVPTPRPALGYARRMNSDRLPLRHFLLALAVVAVWGTQLRRHPARRSTACRRSPSPPLRFFFALVPAVFFLPRPQASWRNLAAYGVLIGAGQFGLLYLAMRHDIAPGLASLVIQLQVFFTIGLAMALTRERVQPFQLLALLLAVAGIVLIGLHTDPSAARGGTSTGLGLVLILLPALAWAGGNTVSRAGRARRHARLHGLVEPVRGAAAGRAVARLRGLAGDRVRPARRRRGDLGRRAVAVGRQHLVRLRRLRLAAVAPSGGDDRADGAAGAGVRHGGVVRLARRAAAGVEARRRRARHGRPRIESAVAAHRPARGHVVWTHCLETAMTDTRPPVPPFTPETARQKVRLAEDAWNTRDPERVVLVYTEDTRWRNRAEFPVGRAQVARVPAAQVGARARLPADQGAVGLRRRAHRRALRLRMARRFGPLVSQLRQRELGVQRRRA